MRTFLCFHNKNELFLFYLGVITELPPHFIRGFIVSDCTVYIMYCIAFIEKDTIFIKDNIGQQSIFLSKLQGVFRFGIRPDIQDRQPDKVSSRIPNHPVYISTTQNNRISNAA
jgi:hypothetical protein